MIDFCKNCSKCIIDIKLQLVSICICDFPVICLLVCIYPVQPHLGNGVSVKRLLLCRVLPRMTHWDFMSLEKGSDEMGRSAIKIKKCVAYLM